MQGKCLGAAWGMPAPVAVLVEVDGEPVFQAYIAYCAICRGPCRGAPPPKVAYARPGKKKTKVAQGEHHNHGCSSICRCYYLCPLATAHNSEALGLYPPLYLH